MSWQTVALVLGILWALVALIGLGYWKDVAAGRVLVEAANEKRLHSVN